MVFLLHARVDELSNHLLWQTGDCILHIYVAFRLQKSEEMRKLEQQRKVIQKYERTAKQDSYGLEIYPETKFLISFAITANFMNQLASGSDVIRLLNRKPKR